MEIGIKPEIKNFRDASFYNPSIMKGIIYRTSNLVIYQEEEFLQPFLKAKNIKVIIDLRADREVLESSYNENFTKELNYIRIPFDPWDQPEWFKQEVKTELANLTNAEKAYHFFIKACNKEIKAVFDVLSDTNGAVAVHCVKGKDRTGLIVMLLGMLVDSDYNNMLNDYLASELDTDEFKFRIYFDYITEVGGINQYLINAGVSQDGLDELKFKFGK